jgi:hypothetical protein
MGLRAAPVVGRGALLQHPDAPAQRLQRKRQPISDGVMAMPPDQRDEVVIVVEASPMTAEFP